jgi:hypothetical protein
VLGKFCTVPELLFVVVAFNVTLRVVFDGVYDIISKDIVFTAGIGVIVKSPW